jgi:hypothetical protein
MLVPVQGSVTCQDVPDSQKNCGITELSMAGHLAYLQLSILLCESTPCKDVPTTGLIDNTSGI